MTAKCGPWPSTRPRGPGVKTPSRSPPTGERHAVIFVDKDPGTGAVTAPAEDLRARQGESEAITSVSIDMSAAYIKGVAEHLPNTQMTNDCFHVVARALAAVNETRRQAQKHVTPSPRGCAGRCSRLQTSLSLTSRLPSMPCSLRHRAGVPSAPGNTASSCGPSSPGAGAGKPTASSRR